MKVGKDKVVLMHYTLKNDAGDVIDSSEVLILYHFYKAMAISYLV